MADNTRVNELQDKLLKAMDILNAQALNSISFDKTITCTIEIDKDKKEGKYEVNDGNRIFTAYSSDTRLRSGDTVYVTVPEGNFENQKMIVGKKTADNDKPFNFTQPFDTFFDMTGNIIIPDKITEENKELIANTIEDEDALIENCKTSTWLIGSKDTNGDIVMTDVSNKDIIKYSRLAVRADFRTWIKNAVRGEYGINIYLRTSKPKTISAENNTEKEYGDYKYNWNNSMMYGNTYNFETYYSQEMVLDLEKQDIGRVDGIAIEFYQKANFYDKFNEPVPSSEDGFKTKTMSNEYERYLNGNGYYIKQGNDLSPNIFIDNFYLGFGYDISTFRDDYVEIYTQNRDSYRRSTEVGNDYAKENQKEIKVRWVHLKDGVPVDMNIEKNQKDIQYEIRWYRYHVGVAAADEYCGVYWDDVDDKNISEDRFIYTLNPDVNKQQEYIKAIVLCNGIPYPSNELIFKNEEELPPSKEAQYIANALNIECKDGSYGNYLLYGQGTKIKDDSLANQDRELVCYFDADNNGEHESEITDNTKITWIFPKKNTMINVIEQEGRIEKDDTQIIVKNAKPKYRVLNNYNSNYSNNTIQCIYELNEVVYTTEIEFTFGKAGTMGSDQTLIIDFVGDQKAYEIDQVKVEFKLRITDHLGVDQDLSNADIKWKWYYNNETNSSQGIIGTSPILSFEEPRWSIDKLHILEASVGQLTTYFSIPIKQNIENTNCAYIQGATEVVYQSDGIADYSKQPYQIYDKEGKIISDVSWEIILPEDAYSYTYYGKISEFKGNTYYSKEETRDSNGKFIGYIYRLITNENWNSSTPYYIKIADNYVGQINKDTNILEPVSLYVKDAPIYGIRAICSGKTIWSQPIFVCQNKWPSTVINKWDGKSLQLDEENSAVIAAAVSAGRKNSDNTFSGVMMGDWSDSDLDTDPSISKQTGLYGFHHGAMSYAFKEDGTAFLGKDGKGRINIDGNDATIYSTNWKTQGMMIDLNDPYIQLNGTYSYKDDSNKTITERGSINLSAKPNTQYPLEIGSKFKVKWDGTIYATNGNFSGTIYGSKLASSNQENRIELEGFFKLSGGGYIGEMDSDTPGSELLNGNQVYGIGIAAATTDAESHDYGIVKATINNAGLSHGKTNFITVGPVRDSAGDITINNNISLGAGISSIQISDSHIALYQDNDEPKTGEPQRWYLAIENNGRLTCNIPAGQQSGIFARFA